MKSIPIQTSKEVIYSIKDEFGKQTTDRKRSSDYIILYILVLIVNYKDWAAFDYQMISKGNVFQFYVTWRNVLFITSTFLTTLDRNIIDKINWLLILITKNLTLNASAA